MGNEETPRPRNPATHAPILNTTTKIKGYQNFMVRPVRKQTEYQLGHKRRPLIIFQLALTAS